MFHVPESIQREVTNVFENFVNSDYPTGFYAGAELIREDDGHLAVNGFEPRWSAEEAWGIDCYIEDDETIVGFFGDEQNFLGWYREMVDAGVLSQNPDDRDDVEACRNRAREGGGWRQIYEPSRA